MYSAYGFNLWSVAKLRRSKPDEAVSALRGSVPVGNPEVLMRGVLLPNNPEDDN
jgi:hypothetical protein